MTGVNKLNSTDKRYLEEWLEMSEGYVLDFNDTTFGDFFRQHGIDIHSNKFQTQGTSKAKKMRSFWDQEPGQKIGEVLLDLFKIYQADIDLEKRQGNEKVLEKCKEIINRLLRKEVFQNSQSDAENFLSKNFSSLNWSKVPVELQVASILEERSLSHKVCKTGKKPY